MSKINTTGFTKRQLIEKSSTTIIAATIIAAIVVSFSLVMLHYMWNLSGHYRKVISEKNKASVILAENVDKVGALQANYNVLEAGDVKASIILDALPSKYDYPALATTIESLVESTGLTLESFSGDDLESEAIQEATVPEPIEINYSLSVSGSYDNIQKFITKMDYTIRPMKVITIELEGSDSSMEAKFKVITYYQPATTLNVETRMIE